MLTNIDGLSALSSVGGNHRNQRYYWVLTNTDGLSALTTVVEESMRSVGTELLLTNVDGLSAVKSGRVEIY